MQSTQTRALTPDHFPSSPPHPSSFSFMKQSTLFLSWKSAQYFYLSIPAKTNRRLLLSSVLYSPPSSHTSRCSEYIDVSSNKENWAYCMCHTWIFNFQCLSVFVCCQPCIGRTCFKVNLPAALSSPLISSRDWLSRETDLTTNTPLDIGCSVASL